MMYPKRSLEHVLLELTDLERGILIGRRQGRLEDRRKRRPTLQEEACELIENRPSKQKVRENDAP